MQDAQKIDLRKMPVREKLKVATELGEKAGTIINEAIKKANEELAIYGYSLTVTLNFHELEEAKSKQE